VISFDFLIPPIATGGRQAADLPPTYHATVTERRRGTHSKSSQPTSVTGQNATFDAHSMHVWIWSNSEHAVFAAVYRPKKTEKWVSCSLISFGRKWSQLSN